MARLLSTSPPFHSAALRPSQPEPDRSRQGQEPDPSWDPLSCAGSPPCSEHSTVGGGARRAMIFWKGDSPCDVITPAFLLGAAGLYQRPWATPSWEHNVGICMESGADTRRFHNYCISHLHFRGPSIKCAGKQPPRCASISSSSQRSGDADESSLRQDTEPPAS